MFCTITICRIWGLVQTQWRCLNMFVCPFCILTSCKIWALVWRPNAKLGSISWPDTPHQHKFHASLKSKKYGAENPVAINSPNESLSFLFPFRIRSKSWMYENFQRKCQLRRQKTYWLGRNPSAGKLTKYKQFAFRWPTQNIYFIFVKVS